MAYLRPLIQRRRSAQTSASIASIAGALLTAFILIQLVLLANHRHHTLTATAVLHLHGSGSSSSGSSTGSAQQPAVSTKAAAPQAAAQHGKLAPKEQQQAKQQQQQQSASKGAAGVAQHAHTDNSNSEEQDLEGVLTPSSARYRQRLSVLEAGPQGQQLLSAAFAPLRISHCDTHMPQHWAPCQNIPHVDIEYAEEVIYPPIVLRIPGFVKDSDKEAWLKNARLRGWTVDNEAADAKDNYQLIVFHPHGQNFVIRNARYTNNPFPDNWSGSNTHCMGYQAEVAQFFSQKPQPDDAQVDELFLDNGPQSSFFQHWMDHTQKVWVQGMHLLTNSTRVLATSPSSRDERVLKQLWRYLTAGVNMPDANVVLSGRKPAYFAKRLIYSCRCPFIHPYHLQRWREWAVGPRADSVLVSQRKVVLYFSRSTTDKQMTNGGRRILNEVELLAAMRQLLVRRNQGEELVVFNHAQFPTYRDLTTYVNTQVRAIIGPHGGGLINLQFASKDTVVMEFQHFGHVNEVMWEYAAPLRLNYHCLIYQPEQGTDMRVNIPDVIQVLGRELGREYDLDHFVAHYSSWKKSLTEGRQLQQPVQQQQQLPPDGLPTL